MRPEVLYSLFAPVTALAGVGPRVAKAIEKATGPRGGGSLVAPAERHH